MAFGSCGVGAGVGLGRGAVLSFQMAMFRPPRHTRWIFDTSSLRCPGKPQECRFPEQNAAQVTGFGISDAPVGSAGRRDLQAEVPGCAPAAGTSRQSLRRILLSMVYPPR